MTSESVDGEGLEILESHFKWRSRVIEGKGLNSDGVFGSGQ